MEKEIPKGGNHRLTSERGVSAREFSAGGVVFKKFQIPRLRQSSGGQANLKFQIKWLVTKSSPSKLYPKSYWRLPKGWLDDEKGKPGPLARGEMKAGDDSLQKAALREVAEEGGVEAKIVKKLGTERIFYTNKSGEKILKFVTYYLMEWQKDLPQGPGFETSEVAWPPYEEARKRLKYSGEKKVLDKAKQTLDSGLQENLI